jgi:prophage regulatory protein
MATAETKTPRLLRRREVEARTGLSRSSIYARMAAGTFPLAVDLGGRAVAWMENEVETWVLARIAARVPRAEGTACPCPA